MLMVMNFKVPASGKPRNLVSKDLRSPKYRMRVVGDKRKKNPKHKYGDFYAFV